jgi:repressor LexA
MGRTPAGQTREKVLRYVRKRLSGGLPPTVRDVQHAFGFKAVQTAREHLEALVAQGHLAKESGVARGYRLPARGSSPTVQVPILGRVAAGGPSLAVEDLEGYVPLRSRRSPESLFGLKVRGESMLGAGILPGDLVIVRRQAEAAPGDIVVALVDDEATVKRFKVRRGHPELHPENPSFPVLSAPEHPFTIVGRVIEVRRTLDRP